MGCQEQPVSDPVVEKPRVVDMPETKITAPAISLEELEEIEPDRTELTKKMKLTVDQFVEEKIPFDEPRVEEGQEDGKLRELWRVAWRNNRGSFGWRGEKYYVRSGTGSAIPPQVCADFIVDVLDRTGGNWWIRYGGRGIRINKENSFSKFIESKEWCGPDPLEPRKCYSRRVVDLVQIMKMFPEYFETLYKEEKNGVRVGSYKDFRQTMDDLNVQFGDIVFINGKTPWDRHHDHWHSFMIYNFDEKKDDWTIVGNAGMVAKRFLRTEGNRTPRRKLWYVFRPKSLLLERINEGIQL